MSGTKLYEWRPGFPTRGVDANAAGQVIEKIIMHDGPGIKPAQVVDAARPKRSPIHALFEWNDAAAAEKYRQRQARDILGSLIIKVIVDKEETNVRQFHAINVERDDGDDMTGRRYVSLEEVEKSPDYMAQVVEQAKRELKTFTEKYRVYSALQQAVEAVRKIADAI